MLTPPLKKDILAVGRIGALPAILKVISELTGMRVTMVARVTPDSWTACAAYDRMGFGLEVGTQLEVTTTLCKEVCDANKSIIIEHASQDPVYRTHRTPKQYKIESYIAIPIVLPDGTIFGTLCAIDSLPAKFEPKILTSLGLFAELISRQLVAEDAREKVVGDLNERTAELAASNLRLRSEMAQRADSETARHKLLQQLTTAEENERRRISRELHDQIGQYVTALLLGLKRLRSRSGAPGLETLADLVAITETVSQEIHDLALQLRPAALDDLGLIPALAHHLDLWSARTGVLVEYKTTCPEAERFPPAVETTIYRLVQEALTNVAKHAQARRVGVAIERCYDHIVAIIEDDGNGFESDPAWPSGPSVHLGLRGMRERATHCGGTINIESAVGQGTTVLARIPLLPDSR